MSKRGARSLAAAFIVLMAGSSASLESLTPGQPATTPPHASMAIIVNAANPISELSVAELRRMLLGETTRWVDGRKITIAMREPGLPERDAVLRLVCGMSELDFTRYLLHAAYRGESQGGLKLLDTPTGVRRFVFNVPGAIGYI